MGFTIPETVTIYGKPFAVHFDPLRAEYDLRAADGETVSVSVYDLEAALNPDLHAQITHEIAQKLEALRPSP